MKKSLLFSAVLSVVCIGCKSDKPVVKGPYEKAPEPIGEVWSASLVARVPADAGLNAPESMVIDEGTGAVYISNIDTDSEGYWEDDGKAFISQIDLDGKVLKVKWLESTESNPFHAPKGMCILNGQLYFTDNTRLKRCDIATGTNPEVIKNLTGRRFNDVATDGKTVWVGDMQANKIYHISEEGTIKALKAPENVNGVTCWNDKVFAVSWTNHDIYEIDPEGEKEPAAFGLAEHFMSLDAVEVLDDGTFIVSDFQGGKVCAVSADRKTVTTLVELETPADLCVNRKTNLMYIPQLKVNKAVIYKLEIKGKAI